jgi:adenosylcobinamide kinase/adenosylcobinamide-phosphate guanylyltransferase
LAKRQHNPPHPLYYIATMKAADGEDTERIARHQSERQGWGFATVEQPKYIQGILAACDPKGSFLLDSLTALLANEMFSPDGEYDGGAYNRVAENLIQILTEINNIVIVSDYIYSDAFRYDTLTESYRKALAGLDRLAASRCDIVLEASYTQIIAHKGGGLLDAVH